MRETEQELIDYIVTGKFIYTIDFLCANPGEDSKLVDPDWSGKHLCIVKDDWDPTKVNLVIQARDFDECIPGSYKQLLPRKSMEVTALPHGVYLKYEDDKQRIFHTYILGFKPSQRTFQFFIEHVHASSTGHSVGFGGGRD